MKPKIGVLLLTIAVAAPASAGYFELDMSPTAYTQLQEMNRTFSISGDVKTGILCAGGETKNLHIEAFGRAANRKVTVSTTDFGSNCQYNIRNAGILSWFDSEVQREYDQFLVFKAKQEATTAKRESEKLAKLKAAREHENSPKAIMTDYADVIAQLDVCQEHSHISRTRNITGVKNIVQEMKDTLGKTYDKKYFTEQYTKKYNYIAQVATDGHPYDVRIACRRLDAMAHEKKNQEDARF